MNLIPYVEKRNQEIGELRKLLDAPGQLLSSGVNALPPPALYTKYFAAEHDYQHLITNYTRCDGNPVLKEAIATYERLISTDSDSMNPANGFAANICVTAGATAALMFYFEYYSQKYPGTTVLFLGLNYYAFYEYCNRYQLKKIILNSKEKNRIAPTFEEITRVIQTERPKLIALTLPLNPSGEIYTEDELRRLISLLKKYDIILLIDKVQSDVLAANFDYININKIIVAEQFIDNTVIVDSLSKTRSLPGARLGYIIADKETITYITYLNELCYYNPPQIYILPFIIDLMSRVIYFKQKYGSTADIRFILKLFRLLTRTLSFLDQDSRLIKIFSPSSFNEEYTAFTGEIQNNYVTIMDNYKYLINKLDVHICEKTLLQGGYNFCIKLAKTKAGDQFQFCLNLFKQEKIVMLPEFFYNDHHIDDKNRPFWIRITCAFPGEQFRKIIDRLNDYLTLTLK